MTMHDTHASIKVSHKPLVSWILCTHIWSDYLRKSIQSCLDQTYQNFELIIVINGESIDSIEEKIIELYPEDKRIRIYKTKIRHLNFSLNLALHYSQGEYIARMDGDDISELLRLESQVKFMEANPKVMVLGTAFKLLDAEGKISDLIQNPMSDTEIRKSLHYRNPINHPSSMIRKNCLLKIGGYMGGLHAEDYDLWCRLSLDESYEFANLLEAYLCYRQVGVGIARKSMFAYATQAASQLNMLLLTFKIRWLAGIALSIGKVIFVSIGKRTWS